MFDFEKLDIYQVVRELNHRVYIFLSEHLEIDEYIRSKWKQASQDVVLNLVEGTGRISNDDKKQFLTASRGFVFECVAILQQLFDLGKMDSKKYEEFYQKYEQASKMLLGMYRSYNTQ